MSQDLPPSCEIGIEREYYLLLVLLSIMLSSKPRDIDSSNVNPTWTLLNGLGYSKWIGEWNCTYVRDVMVMTVMIIQQKFPFPFYAHGVSIFRVLNHHLESRSLMESFSKLMNIKNRN